MRLLPNPIPPNPPGGRGEQDFYQSPPPTRGMRGGSEYMQLHIKLVLAVRWLLSVYTRVKSDLHYIIIVRQKIFK